MFSLMQTTIMSKQPVIKSLSLICCFMAFMLISNSNNVEAMNLAERMEQEQSAAVGKSGATLAVIENPELVARVLENLLRSVLYSAGIDVQPNNLSKRGLDLGISRGYSGSQAGKHLMGLSAASFANGPGRR